MAFTLDQVRDYSSNPASIPAPGTYGEGAVTNIAEMIRTLKDSVKTGKLNVSQYFDIAEPLISQASQVTGSIAGKGSKAANAVNPAWSSIQQMGAAKAVNGQWQAILPFNAREYAQLPESVLPTQKEVNSGLIPLDLLPPVQRFRPETPTQNPGQPQVNPGPGGQPGQPGGTTQVSDPAHPGQYINIPVVGDPLQNSVPKTIDQSVIEQEGQRQAEQSRQAYEAEQAIRAQRLTDLSGLLTKQSNDQLAQDQPGILEDLNSRGLVRSSALGEALAREKANLATNNANTLMQQGLTDRDSQIQGIKDILAQSQSFQTSGLERKFTLEDFQKEADLSRQLGSQYTPQIAGGKSVLSGVLGGVGTGAAAGGAIGGPWGAGIGAILGGTAGGASSKGK